MPEREEWCPGTESNRRHRDFQSLALPTELPGRNYILKFKTKVIEELSQTIFLKVLLSFQIPER